MNKISKFQKFEAKTIDRSQIKNATYNPRKIGEDQQKALRKSLRVHGLVETLVWNKRTGNLVGGHQRLSQLDTLEKSQNYKLTVSVIDVTIKQEKEINIILNNASVQGEWDVNTLTNLFNDIDIENTGFTDYDLSIFGVDNDIDSIEDSKEVKNVKDSIEKIKEQKQKDRDKNVSKGENYIIITFGSIEAKESFLDTLGHEVDDRYIKGEILAKKINEKTTK
jgi:hypothetical protein